MAMRSMSPHEVYDLHCKSPVALIDVRTPAEFGEVHAKDARLMPLDRFDPKALDGQTVYILCKSGMRAGKAAEKCLAAGKNNVVVVEGGTMAWEQAGLPVVRSGKKVMSLERQVRIVVGLMVLAGVLLGWKFHIGFLAISGFAGVGLIFAGITDTCALGMLLAKMPWNNCDVGTCGCRQTASSN